MRAKFIYEKFTADSDPIHDMGIGKFKPYDLYSEKVLPALREWNKIVQGLVGKTVSGNIRIWHKYVPVKDTTVGYSYPLTAGAGDIFKKVKIVYAEPDMDVSGGIFIKDEYGNQYLLEPEEEYTFE